MKIRYLGYNEVLEIYREQISKFGGYGAVRDNNALLSVVANPQRQFAGQDLYPTIDSKAAILVYSMIRNHPFMDGNKRVAFVCGRAFLRLNGHDVESLEGYCDLILKIARSQATQEDVCDWFKLSVSAINELKNKVKGETR